MNKHQKVIFVHPGINSDPTELVAALNDQRCLGIIRVDQCGPGLIYVLEYEKKGDE